LGLEKKCSWGIDPRRAIPSVHRDINYPTEELLASELARSFPFAPPLTPEIRQGNGKASRSVPENRPRHPWTFL